MCFCAGWPGKFEKAEIDDDELGKRARDLKDWHIPEACCGQGWEEVVPEGFVTRWNLGGEEGGRGWTGEVMPRTNSFADGGAGEMMPRINCIADGWTGVRENEWQCAVLPNMHFGSYIP